MRGYPLIEGNAVYSFNAVADKHNTWRLSKLDLRTGKPLWAAPEEEDLATVNEWPVIVGGHLVVVSRNRTLSAYDTATGQRVWQHLLTRVCDPTLAACEGLVFFSGGLPGTVDHLTALDPANGKTVWSRPLSGPSGNGCGTEAAVSGGLVVVGLGRDLLAFDARSGEPRWVSSPAPVVDGRRQPLALSRLVLDQGVIYTASPTQVVGVELASGRAVTGFALPEASELSTLTLATAGGVLFIAGRATPPEPATPSAAPAASLQPQAYLMAIDVATRALLWRHSVSPPGPYNPKGSWGTKHFLPVDGTVYFENEQRLAKLLPGP